MNCISMERYLNKLSLHVRLNGIQPLDQFLFKRNATLNVLNFHAKSDEKSKGASLYLAFIK